MYTFQNIKDLYYTELALEHTDRMSLDEYIKANFVQVYDDNLNFLGYDHA